MNINDISSHLIDHSTVIPQQSRGYLPEKDSKITKGEIIAPQKTRVVESNLNDFTHNILLSEHVRVLEGKVRQKHCFLFLH